MGETNGEGMPSVLPSVSSKQREVFLEVYLRAFKNVFWLGYSATFGAENARDAAQEAFARMWELLAEGKDIENMEAMVCHIVRNLLKDAVDRKRTRDRAIRKFPRLDRPYGKEITQILSFDVDKMLTVLDTMDIRYRRVLTLRYLDGLDVKTTAKRLGLRITTVKVQSHRGIKHLHKLLDDPL